MVKNTIISNSEKLDEIADKVIKENKKAVEDYKSGKTWAISYFINGKRVVKALKTSDEKYARFLKKEYEVLSVFLLIVSLLLGSSISLLSTNEMIMQLEKNFTKK